MFKTCIKCYQQEEKQRAAEELEARRLEADKKRARLLEEVVKDHDGDGNGDDDEICQCSLSNDHFD